MNELSLYTTFQILELTEIVRRTNHHLTNILNPNRLGTYDDKDNQILELSEISSTDENYTHFVLPVFATDKEVL